MVRLPEARLAQNPVDTCQRLLQAFQQGGQEPLQPGGDIERSLLAAFQYPVVAAPILENAGGHGIEADGLLLALSQGQVGDGASQPPITIIEGM